MKFLLNHSLFLLLLQPLQMVASVSGDIPLRPEPPQLVNDFVGILLTQEKQQLENKLIAFEKSTGTQIVVVIVEDFAGYDRAEFSYTLGEKWGVGQKGFDNGIVIAIKPTGAKGERQAFIATGYGLEAVIPDAVARRIVEEEMISEFRNGNYYSGLDKAITVLMSLASNEFAAEDYIKKTQERPLAPWVIMLLLILLSVLVFVAKLRNHSLGHDTSLWTLLWLLSASGRMHGGSFGNFSSGKGSFGGFGGGRFGGGGAGGSW